MKSMIKRGRAIGLTILLLIAIGYVSHHMITGELYAIDCRIGPCECECIGSDCTLAMMPLNPYDMSSIYFVGCECSDNSEHCYGAI